MNLLIAEDHPAIQLFNSRLMQSWGFSCDLAYDGVEAVSLARKREGHYDLCVMDVEMPRMNGIEAIAAIRHYVGYFPILALTSDHRYEAPCLAAGADGFALKPCAPETLLEKIRTLTRYGDGSGPGVYRMRRAAADTDSSKTHKEDKVECAARTQRAQAG